MIRNALMVCAGFLIAISVACVAVVPPTTVVRHPLSLAGCMVGVPSSFANAQVISYLDTSTNYSPQSYGTPPKSANPQFPASALTDLLNAFTIAPSFIQSQLCGLDGVFIDPTPCDSSNIGGSCSWGFRDPTANAGGKRYIGLSASIWSGSSSAPPYFTYETTKLNYLLDILQSMPLNWYSGGQNGQPYFDSSIATLTSPDPANTPAMTILAILAHELGHVRWYDINVPQYGGAYYWTHSGLAACKFFDGSWGYSSIKQLESPKWRHFGDAPNSIYLKHLMKPQTKSFENANTLGNLVQALLLLYGDNQPWASLISSLTPDEDFVETYQFDAITANASFGDPVNHPFVQSLRLNIPSVSSAQPDIVSDYFNRQAYRAELIRKVACVKQLNLYP